MRVSGTLVCWGSGAAAFPPSGSYTQLDAGESDACALSPTGGLSCWGDNAQGQADPPPAPAGLTYTQVSVGALGACGLLSDGSLACWGLTPGAPPPGSYTQVAVGTHACAIRTDGTLACWGGDDFGVSSGAPAPPTGRRFTQLASGRVHNCAILDDGSIQCWGNNTFGQLDVPALPAGVRYTQVSVSSANSINPLFAFHSCGLRSDGTAVCWGGNTAGSLDVPPLPDGVTYTSVSAGRFHTCASRSDGVVVCFGLNSSGQGDVPPDLNLKEAQPIAFNPPVPDPAAVGTAFELVPNEGSGNPVILNALTPDVCTIDGTTLSFLAEGTCSFTADREGNDEYAPAPQLTVTVTVSAAKQPQAITFTSTPPDPAQAGDAYAVSATGGASGNPVTFSSLTEATCTVSGTTVSFVAVGDCTVAADQAGNAAYDPAPQVTETIAVRWPFTGFFGLSAAPGLNRLKAGSTLGLSFSLGGNRGTSVLATGSPTIATYACGATPPAPGAGAPARGPGKGNPLVYDVTRGRYTYTWKTEKRWDESCGQLSVGLADGSVHTARFRFQ